MNVGVVINRHSAGGRDETLAKKVRASFAETGVQAEVRLCRSDELAQAAQQFATGNVNGIVAGGGDGTVGTVAEICARSGLPLGILPMGTRNHFGRDLGVPSGWIESIQCIAAGQSRRIDLGSINGRLFINNSSIGAYPRAVEARDELRSRFGLRKHIAGTIATLRVFAQHPVVKAVIEIDGEALACSSPFVFVGNNVYSVKLFAVQHRSSLAGGKLCVYTARCNGIAGLLRLLWLSLWNRLDQSRDFDMRCGTEAVIRPAKPMMRVSKDGEVVRMKTPLKYRIEPGALEVFAPPPAP